MEACYYSRSRWKLATTVGPGGSLLLHVGGSHFKLKLWLVKLFARRREVNLKN